MTQRVAVVVAGGPADRAAIETAVDTLEPDGELHLMHPYRELEVGRTGWLPAQQAADRLRAEARRRALRSRVTAAPRLCARQQLTTSIVDCDVETALVELGVVADVVVLGCADAVRLETTASLLGAFAAASPRGVRTSWVLVRPRTGTSPAVRCITTGTAAPVPVREPDGDTTDGDATDATDGPDPQPAADEAAPTPASLSAWRDHAGRRPPRPRAGSAPRR